MNRLLSTALAIALLALQPGCKISFGGDANTDLILAAETGNLQGVQDALDDGANVNTQAPGAPGANLQNMAPLRQAAQNGHASVVNLLLNKGAQVDILDSLGVTPLIAAAQNGHIDVIKLLVEKGANVEAQAAGLGSITALIIASQNGHLNVVEYLISKEADVNTQAAGLQNTTAIRLAAQNGHLAVVEALAENGADINVVDGMGYTPLSIATQEGHQAVVDFLKAKTASAETQNSSPQEEEVVESENNSDIPASPEMPTPPSPEEE